MPRGEKRRIEEVYECQKCGSRYESPIPIIAVTCATRTCKGRQMKRVPYTRPELLVAQP